MMDLKKLIVLGVALSVLILNQNCGNVDITESSSKSVLSVTSSMVIEMEPNDSKIINIKPEPGSLPIEKISFKEDCQELSVKTQMEGALKLRNLQSVSLSTHRFMDFRATTMVKFLFLIALLILKR